MFGVYLVDSLSDSTQLCNVGRVEEKLYVIPHGQQFVAMPLLHVHLVQFKSFQHAVAIGQLFLL